MNEVISAENLDRLHPALLGAIELAIAVGVIWLGMRLINRLLPEGANDTDHHYRFKRQLIKVLFVVFSMVVLIIALPIPDSTRGQLIGLVGVVFTAMIALGSTSFVSNAMSGIMLRSVNNFKPGDFIKAGEHFGRVTDRGLFHTEIQTETRDLTTLPNLFLVQQPVTVTRSSGTFVSANVSLGYDLPHDTAKKHLMQAIEAADLEDGFVRIIELLDHAVLYQAQGMLTDPKKLLSARSRLREQILNVLHNADIEITSPSHMIQRRLDDGLSAMPKHVIEPSDGKHEEDKDAMIFDKAEAAEKTETLRSRREDLKAQLEATDDKEVRGKIKAHIERLDKLLEQRAEKQKES
ncbi:MAG: mechanosensitive ion channel family protein [Salinisphaeraceae bacterium]|nr:mechanosensitive ion channel family protein [Salinisphaeraceae bacterium]